MFTAVLPPAVNSGLCTASFQTFLDAMGQSADQRLRKNDSGTKPPGLR